MPAFIAANYIMNYYCEHNICPMKTKIPVTTDTIMVSRDLHMKQVADLCNIDIEAIRALNPQYRTDLIPGSAGLMSLCLPTETLNTLIDLKDSVYNYNADELMTRRATVEVDEKLDNRSVASRRRSRSASTDSKASQSASSSRSESRSSSKSSSRGSRSSSKSSSKSRKKSQEREKSTTVKKGDTLYEIAAKNGTTVEKLKKLNKIKGNTINPGKKLRVK